MRATARARISTGPSRRLRRGDKAARAPSIPSPTPPLTCPPRSLSLSRLRSLPSRSAWAAPLRHRSPHSAAATGRRSPRRRAPRLCLDLLILPAEPRGPGQPRSTTATSSSSSAPTPAVVDSLHRASPEPMIAHLQAPSEPLFPSPLPAAPRSPVAAAPLVLARIAADELASVAIATVTCG